MLFISTIEAVAILLGLGTLGYWIISRNMMPAEGLRHLGPLTIDIALPCLVFFSIIQDFNPSNSPGWWLLPIWWIGFQVCSFIFTVMTQKISKKEWRGEFKMVLFYQNAIFFPLIILSRLFGESSTHVINLFLFSMLFPPFFFNTYSLFIGKRGAFNWKRTFNPVLVATVLALLVKLGHYDIFIPEFILLTIKMIGAMTLPLLMLIFGGNIYIDLKTSSHFVYSEVFKFIGLKNLLFPLLILGLLAWLNIPKNIGLLILIQAAVPPYTANSIVVSRAGGNSNIVNQFMLGSLVASVLTVPIMIFLFSLT